MKETKSYYLKHEERFGFITSRLYLIGERIPSMRNFYEFVFDDLKEAEGKTMLDVGCGWKNRNKIVGTNEL